MKDLPADYHPPLEKNLGAGTRRILRALAEVILPRNDRLKVDCLDEIVNYVDNYIVYLPPMLRFGFPYGVWVFEIAALFMTGLPFTMLSHGRRERYIGGWSSSSLWWRRDLLKGIKAVMMMGFFDLPDVQRAIGYEPGPYVEAVKARRLAQHAQDLA